MAKDLSISKADLHVTDVVHHGEKILIPEDMTLQQAVGVIQNRIEFMETKTNMRRTFKVSPWDGANATALAIKEMWGWAAGTPTYTMFGEEPPVLHTIATDAYGGTTQVPWGAMVLSALEGGRLGLGVTSDGGRYRFQLSAQVKRKFEAQVVQFFEMVERYCKTHSIYRGKALRIRFQDDDGDDINMLTPEFIATRHMDLSLPQYPKHVTDSIETNLFTPIRRVQDCIRHDIPIKRGVLLGGKYGTGKTLAATAAAKIAEEEGITYVYCQRAAELAHALRFADEYQSPACVVFCEDIDRAVTGERSIKIDDVLNVLDGVDTKNAKVITVLTTNHLDNINPAMLRPGRLDSVIEITPPDAETVTRLLRSYGGKLIDPEVDLIPVGEVLAGQIPAMVAEVVKRAKLSELRRTPVGGHIAKLSAESLLESAHTMKAQIELLDRRSVAVSLTPAQEMYRSYQQVMTESIAPITKKVKAIAENMGL